MTDAPVLTVAQLRAAEAATMVHTPESVLMATAAAALAAQTVRELTARRPVENARVVVLAGTGNNGGDALLAGALLGHDGALVTVVGTGATLHETGLAACERVGADVYLAGAESGLRAALAALSEADAVIDGIAGLGSRPGLSGVAATLVGAIAHGTLVVSADIPSGLDADSGDLPATHVTADVTVTFTALKPCLVTEPAAASAGRVVVADVGVALP